MDFLAHVLVQLGILIVSVFGLVAGIYLAILIFVRKKELPESMRTDEER
jgi:hypothetical protein